MAEKMKDSGIAWIGEIPEEWNLIRMKDCSYMKGRIGWQGLTADEFIDEGPFLVTGTDFEDGHVCWERSYHISEKRYNEAVPIQLQIGDLLVTKDGTIGKLAYIDVLPGKASLNSHLLVIRPLFGKYCNEYLYWVLSSTCFQGYYEKTSSGSTMDSLSQEKIDEFRFFTPEISEQHAIATYLDRKCGQIDDIIADLQRQIECLQNYKKSLISEAVTKGLNPDVPMKDSGCQYIGMISDNAKTIRFKYIASIKPNLVDPINYPDMMQVSPENIISSVGVIENVRTVDEVGVDSWNHYFFKGQILYSKIRPALNKVAIASFDGLCSADMYPIETILPIRYLLYYMLSDVFVLQTKEVSAIRVKMPKVNQDELGNFIVVIHDDETMNQIAAYLDRKCAQIDTILDDKRRQVENMKNHRKSVIYEYVTGKKRV